MLSDVTKPFQPAPPTGNCKKCGTPLGRFAPNGVCPRCLLQAGLFDAEDEPTAGCGDDSKPASVPGERSLGRFGDYELLEEIARGGMGIVYRAQQLNPERMVALKMLLPHQLASPEMRERFRLETQVIATLEHPAILPVYHVGEHDGLPFFTMKLAPGGTLAFDTYFPGLGIIGAAENTRVLELEMKHPATGLPLRMYDTRSFDRVNQIQHSVNEIELLDADGSAKTIQRSKFSVRWAYKAEMALLLRVAGFSHWEIFGDFDRRPLKHETDAMIVMAW
jgi:hypothetical protein